MPPTRQPLRRAALLALPVAALLAGCTGPGAATTPSDASTIRSSPSAARPSVSPSTPASTSGSTAASTSGSTSPKRSGARVEGVDVSAYNPRVDWTALHRDGVRFAWVKASEGTTWSSPRFTAQWAGARAAGLLTGAYHYARPANSPGAAQARHFVRTGGAWTADGRTLPGALDLERNTGTAGGGDPCYGLTPTRMVAWIRDFVTTYRDLTGRAPVIYVQTPWWIECTGNDTTLAADSPLWLYDHEAPEEPLPAGWPSTLVWQYGVREGLDRNVFHGDEAALRRWALRAPP